MALSEADLLARMQRAERARQGDGFVHVTFPAMGTINDLQFRPRNVAEAEPFLRAVFGWLAAFEAKFSRFLPDSLVGRINAAAGLHPVATDDQADELLALCDFHHMRTKGAFDPTLGPLVRLWSGRTQPPAEEEIQAARALSGWSKVVRSPGRFFLPEKGMHLDLGGIGKEWAVDQVCHLADQWDVTRYAVSFGRDIRVSGAPPEGERWQLGLEHPGEPDRCWEGVSMERGALCCSGDYRRYFEFGGRKFGHIVDPRSGVPAQTGCHAAWVIAPTCTDAGMLATTILIVGADEGLKRVDATPGASACVWMDDELLQTRRFNEYRSSLHETNA